jgi:flagellin
LGIAGLTVDYDSGTPGELAFANAGTTDLSVSGQFKNAASGGLGALSTIDVSTAGGATTALGNIESMLQTSIDAAAEFGSSQTRIDIQSTFVGALSDALKSGIGTMVDANMEETSARLQALQVQQQLATQSLSIANQAPQSVLSLFR